MEAPQDAQAFLVPVAVRLPLVELRTGRMRLRWLLPLAGWLLNLVLMVGLQPIAPEWLMAVLTALLVGSLAGWAFVVYRYYPQAGLRVVGMVVCSELEVELLQPGQPTRHLALSPGMARLLLRYEGYANERLDRYKSASGYHNFLTLPGGQPMRLQVADRHTADALRQVLRRWYELRIPIKESRLDTRTFLLELNPSYEQLQAYKREFNVSLYS